MQLHPHFIFNTLNAIVVLVRQRRVEEADEMLTNLSELLRQTLAGWETQEVPLRRELELTNLYLDIQRVRFQDRLTMEVNFSPATLDALVPILKGYGDARPSMLQDIERGRITEIDFINGYVVSIAPKFSVHTPVKAAIVETVHAITRGQLAPDPSLLELMLQASQ